MRILKLSATAFCSFLILLAIASTTHRKELWGHYLCWKQALRISSCFGGGPIEFVMNIDGIEYEGVVNNLIDRNIFWYGAYEKPNLYLLRDIMRIEFANQGTFVDIGANTGQHSLFMAQYSRQVHSFEPWEPVLKRFRKMIARNRIKNITIHPYGLGDQNAKLPFFKPPDTNLGTGSFVEGFQDGNSPEGTLEIKRGDDVFDALQPLPIVLIKMDIEGYEKPALIGIRRTLEKHRPIVLFELSAQPSKSVSINSVAELRQLFPSDYTFLVVSEKSDLATGRYFLQSAESVIRFDRLSQYAVLAHPKERSSFLKEIPTGP